MGLIEDLRYGLRALAKHRAFAAVAVLSLALGMGANTTVFTLVNAVLLRSLPVQHPDRLAAVYTVDAHNPGNLGISYPNYKDFRDHNQSFSSLLLYSPMNVILTGGAEPQLLWAQIVSGNYFDTLGVRPAIGRGFTPEEDGAPGGAAVAVLSHTFWQQRLGGDPQVLTRNIELNGRAFRIVGVAPQGFEGVNELAMSEVWVPMAMYEQVYPNVPWVNQRRALLFQVVGRLKPGVGPPQAETELRALAAELERQFPKDNSGRTVRLASLSEAAISGRNRPVIGQAGAILLIISALVALIACANVANLLLARAAGRSREITVRLALGASRWRLVRQLLTESVVLALLGGIAGLALARWAGDILWAMRPPLFKHSGIHLDLDRAVLLYTLALSVVTGVLFGLVPALRATRLDLASDLKERTGQPSSARGRWHPRALLVIGQVAFCVIALLGAGLFIRSLANAGQIDPGFEAGRLGVVGFSLGEKRYGEARGREFQRQTIERALATPGVEAASLSTDVPFRVGLARTIQREGIDSPASRDRFTLTGIVWPGYLRTLGIPILRGRDFGPLDQKTAPRVAIVNEAAATAYWPGEDPVGKRIRFYGENASVEVIGVARNANYQAIGERPQALVYISMLQYYFPAGVLWIRTAGDPVAIAASVRRAIQPLDPQLLLQSDSVTAAIRESLWAQTLSANLLAIFGLLALLLSVVGIYGVISYLVHQRVREIGVRMALGATAADVQRLILQEGVRLVAIGLAIGAAIALTAARRLEGMLFVIGPRDALTFLLVPSILGLVAVLACWLPALRATRVDPSRALRDE